MVPLINIFSQVVDAMRKTGDVIALLRITNNTYSFQTTNPAQLAIGDYITIGSVDDIVIQDIEGNEIRVLAGNEMPIGDSWKTNAPYFLFEKPIEVKNLLIEKDNSKKYKYQKYPLVYLYLDITENRDNENYQASIANNIKILLVTGTDKLKDANWRHENTFANVLRPLYELFMRELKLNTNIITPPNEKIAHDYTERFYMSSQDILQNFIADYIDAVEINIANLKIRTGTKC